MGECLAEGFLEHHGYQILERNYRSGRGEIDIIALRERLLVFAEVKTRSNIRGRLAQKKVRWYQQQKIKKTAFRYLSRYYWEGRIRFDLIVVSLDQSEYIQHFPGYFS